MVDMERYDDMWKYLVLLAPDLQHLPIFSPKLRKQITGNVSENVLFGDQSETFNKLYEQQSQKAEGEAGIFL